MKTKYITLIYLCLFALIPAGSWAYQAEGTIQGYHCVTTGKTCPLGKEDPMIAAERIFVLYTDDGKYYFVPNLDRAVLARHIRERVRITGDLNEKYRSLKADLFEVKLDDAWKETWSQELQMETMNTLQLSPF